MVTVIKSSCSVSPSKPTPNGLLWLSECDQIKPWTLVPTIYIYKPPTNLPWRPTPQLYQILKLSLSQALVPFYPLAGRLHWSSDGGGLLELECNAMGALLLEAESDETIDELGDFCPSERTQRLVPKVDYTSPIETRPLFVAQLTTFRCGGVCVGVAISHTLVDGFSGINFVNSWAKLARGESLEATPPVHDRTLLRRTRKSGFVQPPRFDHEELQSWPLLIGCSDDKMERKKETTVAMLRVTQEQIEKLKQSANDKTLKSKSDMGRRPYSTFEVIVAHVWRCACLARSGDNNQETRLRILVNCRNRLNPPLPAEYFGNATLPGATPTCVFGDLRCMPLSYAARKIREASEKITDDYIKSALDFVASQENLSGFRTSFHDKGSMMEEGTYLGNPNISANTWASLPFYSADFGWGKPAYVGPAAIVSDGKFIIVRTSSDREGPLGIAIRLQTPHMDPFRKYFYGNLCV